MMSGGSEAVMTSPTSTTATTNHHHNINIEPPSPPPPPPFTLTSPTSHSQPQPVIQNMSFAGYNPSEGMIMNNMGQQPIKKKRGRPRKYGPDSSMGFSLSGTPQTSNVEPPHHQPGGGFPPPPPSVVVSGEGEVVVSATPVSTSMKKRGRPPGSGKKRLLLEAMGSAGFGFTPHVITVKAGEDVSSKIMSFSQNGPRAVCILSANGSISNVTLRQPSTSGGTVTYEGRFEILSLSGSYLPSDDGGQRSRTGGLSISLSGPDGRVLGGSVAGLLVAAAPVQVVVGSFVSEGRKEPKPVVTHAEPLSAAMRLTSPGSTGGGSPQSRGTLSESSGGPGSPLNQISGACNNNNPQSMSGISWK